MEQGGRKHPLKVFSALQCLEKEVKEANQPTPGALTTSNQIFHRISNLKTCMSGRRYGWIKSLN